MARREDGKFYCPTCGKTEPEISFTSSRNICWYCNMKYKREYRAKNAEELAAKQKEYYVANKERALERARLTRIPKAAYIRGVKTGRGCKSCGVRDYRVLDFHHRDPSEKVRPVSIMTEYSKERLRAEIAKCDVLCSNCHRRLRVHGYSDIWEGVEWEQVRG